MLVERSIPDVLCCVPTGHIMIWGACRVFYQHLAPTGQQQCCVPTERFALKKPHLQQENNLSRRFPRAHNNYQPHLPDLCTGEMMSMRFNFD